MSASSTTWAPASPASTKALAPVLAEIGGRGLLYLDDGSSAREPGRRRGAGQRARISSADVVLDADATPGRDRRAAQPACRDRPRARLRDRHRHRLSRSPIDRVAAFAKQAAERGIAIVPVTALAGTRPIMNAKAANATCPTAPASASPCSTGTARSGSAGAPTRTPRARAKAAGGRCRKAASTTARIPRRRRSASSTRRPRSRASACSRRRRDGSPTTCRRDLIPTSWGGRYRGQKQKWFALRFEGEDSEIDDRSIPAAASTSRSSPTGAGSGSSACPELIVPFKRAVYEQVVAAFRDLAAD